MNEQEYWSSMSPKGQITLPADIRRRLGLKPRDMVTIRLDAEGVRVRPAPNAFLAARGALPPLSPPRDLKEMTEIAADEAAEAAAREGLPDGDEHS